MKITLQSYEVIDSILEKIKEKYGMDVNRQVVAESSVECQEAEYAYQKHKNGRLKNDENGCRIIDYQKSKWVTKAVDFCDAELHLYFD